MPELRRDPVSGGWVIIAPERANRPLRPQPAVDPTGGDGCPFCPGNEGETPPEILAIRPPDGLPNAPDWKVRVFPNRYPALVAGASSKGGGRGLFQSKAGTGVHEVVVETADHVRSLTELDDEEVALALGIFRERLRSHRGRKELAYSLLFKNVGPDAGASIEHTHAQIIGTPVVPGVIDQEARAARRQWRDRRRCIFCEMMRLEASAARRMVSATEAFVALCPFASRFPLEFWILPTSHAPDFDTLPDALVGPLASLLRRLLARVEREMGCLRYNVLFHTAPFRRKEDDSFHWHIEVLPRIGTEAGFEWGSGLHVNPIPPEDAAARLRGGGGSEK